uniref:BCDHK_Adom3 domain-containing protein n=1 Tax=Macrostomum lignano TaxID=282301 RepID=A0A1I8IWQ3_9PLAT
SVYTVGVIEQLKVAALQGRRVSSSFRRIASESLQRIRFNSQQVMGVPGGVECRHAVIIAGLQSVQRVEKCWRLGTSCSLSAFEPVIASGVRERVMKMKHCRNCQSDKNDSRSTSSASVPRCSWRPTAPAGSASRLLSLCRVAAAATTPQAEETINEMQAADFVHQLDSRLGARVNFVDFLRDLVVYSAYYPELRAFKPLVDQAVQNYELCRYVTCSTDYLGPG